MKFNGKTALVTGAGGGMGLAIANQLIRAGVNVCLADVKPAPDNIATGNAETAGKSCGKYIYVQGDLSDEASVRHTVDRAAEEFGGIDYLANPMGVLWFGKDKSALDIDMEVWDQVMNINLRSIVLLAKYVVPHMQKAGGGAMVHFSSVDALNGDTLPQDAYGAAKAAVIRLSKSLAIQLAADNIRSNVILPGQTLTPMQDRWKDKPDLQTEMGKKVPLGRLGSAEDMANACLFLLSDNASYITATELIVDGGITALP